MKRIVFVLALAACGGKSSPATEPAKPADGSGENGIGEKEAAESACYETCLGEGPKGATDWASKSDADKQTACSAECKDAGKGMPSDVKN